jgi:hypothetical protein
MPYRSQHAALTGRAAHGARAGGGPVGVPEMLAAPDTDRQAASICPLHSYERTPGSVATGDPAMRHSVAWACELNRRRPHGVPTCSASGAMR